MKHIKDFPISPGDIVLLRVDFDFLKVNDLISNIKHIDNIRETLSYLIVKKAKIILIPHQGSCTSGFNNNLSFKSMFPDIVFFFNLFFPRLADKKIDFLECDLTNIAERRRIKNIVREVEDGSVFILDNIRLYKQEILNDSAFAKGIEYICDVYVNEAFSCSYMAHASIDRIRAFSDYFVGFSFYKEFAKAMEIKKDISVKGKSVISGDICLIFGGNKNAVKISIIKTLLLTTNINYILFGGEIVGEIMKYRYPALGKVDEKLAVVIKKLFSSCKDLENILTKIVLPIDFIVRDKDTNKIKYISNAKYLNSNMQICDIGYESIKIFKEIIDKSCYVIWNGPLGMYENKKFANGSYEIFNAIFIKAVINRINVVNNDPFIDFQAVIMGSSTVDCIGNVVPINLSVSKQCVKDNIPMTVSQSRHGKFPLCLFSEMKSFCDLNITVSLSSMSILYLLADKPNPIINISENKLKSSDSTTTPSSDSSLFE